MTFHPLVHEAHGRVGISAHRALKICVEKIVLLRCQPVGSVIHYWRSRLSLALQISQARAVPERFRASHLAHTAGSDESPWLTYRGIAWCGYPFRLLGIFGVIIRLYFFRSD